MGHNRCRRTCNHCNCLLTAPFRIIGTALANFSENMELISRIEENKRSRAKRTELKAKRKYTGTRVVEVAQKIYKHWLRNDPPFWLLSESSRDNYFQMAEEQLLADQHCWNTFAIIRGKIFNLFLHPIAYCVYQINEGANLPHEWHCRLYHWHVVLDRNWRAVPYEKIQTAKACSAT